MGASLLRLHFSDCFVNGCDASVLLDDDTSTGMIGEKGADQNANSLRGFNVIDDIKAAVDEACGALVVSCADILAVAARDSVVALGGPSWAVQLGRRDNTTASLIDANIQLPRPTMNIDAVRDAFSSKGFSDRETVALSGAHTIGQARCTVFRNRLYSGTNINPVYAANLKTMCPESGGDDNLAPIDTSSPTVFNNDYFTNLMRGSGLLHSDQQLLSGGSTSALVVNYANDGDGFNSVFAEAMKRMSELNPLTGTDGEIRTNCRRTN